jgi:predicted regulator of Ras-like GTPase activity (Roadblock/LC7/MglB family)
MRPDDEKSIDSLLSRFTSLEWAEGAFVINASGMVVGNSGVIPCEDLMTLGVLVWGIYSSAEQIHTLMGDTSSPSLTHQSNHHKVFLFGLPDKSGILAILSRHRTLTAQQMSQVRSVSQAIRDLIPADDGNWMQASEPEYHDVHLDPTRLKFSADEVGIDLNNDIDATIFSSIEPESKDVPTNPSTSEKRNYRNPLNGGSSES